MGQATKGKASQKGRGSDVCWKAEAMWPFSMSWHESGEEEEIEQVHALCAVTRTTFF